MEIGKFLRECRLKSSHSLTESSGVLGYDIEPVENGVRDIPACDIEALMRFYGTDPIKVQEWLNTFSFLTDGDLQKRSSVNNGISKYTNSFRDDISLLSNGANSN